MKQFGPQAVVDLARKLGITDHLDAVPSLCLGSADLSVYEMVGANATFANEGVWVEPTFITRIEDKNGIVLEEFMPRRVEAISPQTAYLTLSLMKGVVDYGTGARLRFRYDLRTPIAGKTGTTSNYSDSWYIGFTKDLICGVWVGGDDRSIHFRSRMGDGSRSAMPIFGKFMQNVYTDKKLSYSPGAFPKPKMKITKDYQGCVSTGGEVATLDSNGTSVDSSAIPLENQRLPPVELIKRDTTVNRDNR
jgi:penicillin-binding protein 1A